MSDKIKINMRCTMKKLYLVIAYDHGYIFNHKITNTNDEAIKWCSKYGGCDTNIIPFELENSHFGIVEDIPIWNIYNHPDVDEME